MWNTCLIILFIGINYSEEKKIVCNLIFQFFPCNHQSKFSKSNVKKIKFHLIPVFCLTLLVYDIYCLRQMLKQFLLLYNVHEYFTKYCFVCLLQNNSPEHCEVTLFLTVLTAIQGQLTPFENYTLPNSSCFYSGLKTQLNPELCTACRFREKSTKVVTEV